MIVKVILLVIMMILSQSMDKDIFYVKKYKDYKQVLLKPRLEISGYGILSKPLERKEIGIVFEEKFNDSIVIYLNDIEKYRAKIKTSRIGVCANQFFLKREHFSDKVSILFVDMNLNIEFKVNGFFAMCYINRLWGEINVVLSNHYRVYKS